MNNVKTISPNIGTVEENPITDGITPYEVPMPTNGHWVIEVLVRWNHAARKKSFFKYLLAIIVTVFGLVFGWVDVIWCLLFKHLIFCN